MAAIENAGRGFGGLLSGLVSGVARGIALGATVGLAIGVGIAIFGSGGTALLPLMIGSAGLGAVTGGAGLGIFSALAGVFRSGRESHHAEYMHNAAPAQPQQAPNTQGHVHAHGHCHEPGDPEHGQSQGFAPEELAALSPEESCGDNCKLHQDRLAARDAQKLASMGQAQR